MTKHSTVTAVVFLCALLGYTSSQGNVPNTDEVLNKISDAIGSNNLTNIPDLGTLNASVIPVLDEFRTTFKRKCEKNGGGEQAFENAEQAKNNLEQCIKSFVNITNLQEEMKRYRPTGDLDVLFKKYCQKTPVLKKCVSNFTAAIEPCLEPQEKENKKIVQNITDSVLNFVCFKEGDRIALFISADGPTCLESKQQEIQNCVNSTFGIYVPEVDSNSGAFGLENLPPFLFGNKECTNISKIQSCVVKELEKCPDPTTANIMDAIFNYILKVTPCVNITSDSNSASSTTINLVITSVLFLILQYM